MSPKAWLALPAREQLMARVEITPSCWLWTGARRGNRGYGKARYHGIAMYAHRAFYREFVGDIPDGLFVCHRCDNTRCVNPSHLFVGSALDNNRDAVAKGRHAESRKTHCKHGHPFAGANLIVRQRRRICRACGALSSARRRAMRARRSHGVAA